MGHYGFGSGSLFGISGDTVPTPVQFGTLQEVSIEFTFSDKELKGQYQFPEAVGRAGAKITGKAKLGRFQGDLIQELFFGDTTGTKAVGQTKAALNEAGAVPATPGPYTVTVSNSATWTIDLGVFFTATGLPLTRVASAPTTGQYSVAAGVYTFASADTLLAVKISYMYTVALTGWTVSVVNTLMGLTPTFKIVLVNEFKSKQMLLVLNACTSTKLSLPTKAEDFVIPEFDFAAQTDDAGSIGLFSGSSY